MHIIYITGISYVINNTPIFSDNNTLEQQHTTLACCYAFLVYFRDEGFPCFRTTFTVFWRVRMYTVDYHDISTSQISNKFNLAYLIALIWTERVRNLMYINYALCCF